MLETFEGQAGNSADQIDFRQALKNLSEQKSSEEDYQVKASFGCAP